MRKVLLAAAACALMMPAHAADAPSGPATAATIAQSDGPSRPKDDPLYPVTEFIDALNAGDLDKAASFFATSTAIIDPRGARFAYHSFADWRRDFSRIYNGTHFTAYHLIAGDYLSIGSSSDGQSECNLPMVATFKLDGVEHHHRGLVEFTTARTKEGWRITGWSWADMELQPFWDSVPGPVFRPFDLPK